MGLLVVKPSGKGHNKALEFNKGHIIEPSPYILNSQYKVLTSFDKLQYDNLANFF
jgi:hypothetical protein